MRFLILSLALSTAMVTLSRQLRGQPPPPPAGCYLFPDRPGLFPWSTYDRASGTSSEHGSSLIAFTATPTDGAAWFQLRVPAMRDTTAQREFANSAWRRLAPDSVALTWGDGFSGLTMRLQVRGDSLVGTASAFSDAIPGVVRVEMRGDSLVVVGPDHAGRAAMRTDHSPPLIAHRVPCPPAPPRGGAT